MSVTRQLLDIFRPKEQTVADKEGYFSYIDGLRGTAILLVVLVHCFNAYSGISNSFIFPFEKEFITQYGPAGVQLFFMLSAFTLFNSSKRRYTTDAHPVANFYIRRFFRIYPLFALAIVLYSLDAKFSLTITRLIGNLLFLPSLSSSLFWLGTVPGAWTLMCEETFYVFLPVIYKEIKNASSSFQFLLATCILSLTWVTLAPAIGIKSYGGFIYVHPLRHWFCFAAGISLYFLSRHENFRRLVIENPAMRWPLDLSAGFSAIVCSGNFYAQCLALALFFTASMSEATICGKIMRNRLLMLFGAYCYSIYLFNHLLIWTLDPFRARLFSALGITHTAAEIQLLITFPLTAAICLLAGFISFNLLEKPSVRLGRYLMPKANNYLDRFTSRNNQADNEQDPGQR
ncbi:MAG: acyltransferase [Elusimicrobia bacterium]|nr:acyltransferase [Elusimicrobiota bacterium]